MLEQYMPHGACFLWKTDILLPFVVGEFLTALSCLALNIAIVSLVWGKGKIEKPLRPMALVYSVFILFCGIGHALNIVNVWMGFYRLSSQWSLVTSLVSLISAVSTVYLVKAHYKVAAQEKSIYGGKDKNGMVK